MQTILFYSSFFYILSSSLVISDQPTKAIAIMEGDIEIPGTEGIRSPIFGTVKFIESGQSTIIEVAIRGLLSGKGVKEHGLHVHQFGITVSSFNTSERCNSAGPHYNPLNMTHGGLNTPIRHFGDFGNVESNEFGDIEQRLQANLLLLSGKNSIIGRALVLHSNKDDLGLGGNLTSKETGNSGTRIACGDIGIDK